MLVAIRILPQKERIFLILQNPDNRPCRVEIERFVPAFQGF